MRVRIYNARGMTGHIKSDVVKEAASDKGYLERAGFEVLCPVEKENVKAEDRVLLSSKKAMQSYWPADKAMIRDAHVIFDFSPHLDSEGVKHEIGYGRYCLWKPIVRIFPTGKLPVPSSVAYFEDDLIVDSIEEAIEYTLRVHGTFLKRLKWRLSMLNRSFPKWVLHQLQEFK